MINFLLTRGALKDVNGLNNLFFLISLLINIQCYTLLS
ncbi:hypothetical protein SAMN05421740_101419 [Parapedobacter koreensis]|uniref:Uncharacterized protein n=1 Tax=Parapedobacter koreensis TaxID=332977 RepID=A0A1H7FRB2_9SPHI|nr:hypothetical protein SAMN05421740_101419 [Parapedobacter koreensis]